MVGIYSITCRENGKRYIGQTVDLHKRRNEHFNMMSKGKHYNPHLQRAWNNGCTFDFDVIEECEKSELNEKEIFWIDHFGTMDMSKGYNLCAGGKSTLGRVCSEETKRKISEGNKGKKLSEETIRKRTATLKKRLAEDPEFAESYRRQLRENNKGNAWNKGRPCPEWLKEHNRKCMTGFVRSEEHKQKLRELYSGEKSLTAKLTERQVVEIRYRFLMGERQIDICKDYPVGPQTIYDIVRGRRWQSVPMDLESLKVMLNKEEKYG